MRSRWLVGIIILAMVALSGCRVVARVNIPSGEPFPSTPGDAAASSPSLSDTGTVAAYSSLSATLVAGDVNNVADVFVRSGTTTYRVSVGPGDVGGNGASTDPQVSGDGSVVAFVSEANNLVAGDTNGVADVFVADLVTGTVSRVSLGSGAAQANGASSEPAVSADGRYVVFTSQATNLVAGDTNGVSDVFVHDRVAGTTTRASVTGGGAQANGASRAGAISPSGNWVAFESDATNLVGGDTNNRTDVFAALRAGGTIVRMSTPDALTRPFQQSNGDSTDPQITDELNNFIGSGEPLVVYTSTATNLAGNDNNGGGTDVFASTRLFSTIASTTRLSASALPSHSPTVAVIEGGPGHVMAFVTGDDVVSTLRSSPIDPSGLNPQTVSATATGVMANGVSADPGLSGDGRFITFFTTAGNLNNPSLDTTAGDVVVARARGVVIDSIEDPFIGIGETRQFTVTGSGFDTGAAAFFDGGITASSVTVVSSTELVIVATATPGQAASGFRDLIITVPGVDGTSVAMAGTVCNDCIEIASVVDQGGPVDIEILSGSIQIESLTLPLPSCPLGFCPALPATVGFDGTLGFGAESVEIDGIEVPVELIPGIPTTVELVPVFDAPAGTVIPATGAMELSFGFGIQVRSPLLPSGCGIGPVGASLSTANAGGAAYDQNTGLATLAGSFTEELAITGCGLFTGLLNGLLNLPSPIAQNSLQFGIRFDPVLTGTMVP
jgi:hypothetical protein